MTARDATTETDPTDEVVPDEDARATAVDLGKPSTPAGEPTAAAEPTPAEEGDATAAEATDTDAGATDTDAGSVEAGAGRAHRRRRERPGGRRRWPLVALLVVSLLFAGAMATLYVVRRPAAVAGLSSSQQAAVDAATQAAVNLQTFRRASFDQDFANALASLTPQFGQQQLAPRKAALQKQLSDGGRDATATALSAGLVSSTKTGAVVLVVTNTTQTADNGSTTPFVFSRLQLTLQLTGGRWLVSDLKSVGLS